MSDAREQAIDEIAGPGSTNLIRAIIDRYEAARARIDGAKMMPREATEEMIDAGVAAEWGGTLGSRVANCYRAMHGALRQTKDNGNG